MNKYKCKACGHLVESDDFNKNYTCPLCGKTNIFEDFIKQNKLDKAIPISDDNLSIDRIVEKCVNCGKCIRVCPVSKQILSGSLNACLGCGLCIKKCPVGSLIPKYTYNKVLDEINDSKKTVVVITSPGVKVSIGDGFRFECGTNIEKVLVTALKKIGFDYVFDTTFGADLTIMEEGNELIDRIKNKKELPMFTSCCPSWVKYCEMFHPDLITNLSSCKSPIGMQAAILKSYFCEINNIKKEDLVVVCLTPCTAKKQEIKRVELYNDADYVITAAETINLFKEKNINLNNLEDSEYDDIFKGSGAGVIFGKTGGVMFAAIRYAYYILTEKKLDLEKIDFSILDGYSGIKKASIKIKDNTLNIAVVSGINEIDQLINDIKTGKEKLDFIEVMVCVGGCINGGGQPLTLLNQEEEVAKARINGLINLDKEMKIRTCFENSNITKLYDEFLEKPLSIESYDILHTSYQDKSNVIKGL